MRAPMQHPQASPLALIGSARSGRRTLLDMLLSVKGYEIALCSDGPSVLDFLKEHQPAIAIFDHDLPGMDGREISSRMRFITRLADTPIAIVTPTIEEMGGAAEFEGFVDTTTADIVEAEPLGKKNLVERLEGVIRDQKGSANAGKMTIAIPAVMPPIPMYEPEEVMDKVEVWSDQLTDDDLDFEIDHLPYSAGEESSSAPDATDDINVGAASEAELTFANDLDMLESAEGESAQAKNVPATELATEPAAAPAAEQWDVAELPSADSRDERNLYFFDRAFESELDSATEPASGQAFDSSSAWFEAEEIEVGSKSAYAPADAGKASSRGDAEGNWYDDMQTKTIIELVTESIGHEEDEIADVELDVEAEGVAAVSTAENLPHVIEALAVEANELGIDANNSAELMPRNAINSPLIEADVRESEKGEPAVLNDERANMQALIDEQAERIDNLQQRNVTLRQELEQRKTDDSQREDDQSNLQALIKEQTEAITTLQQRNVQLRQELEQLKRADAKRESDRTFLQGHTSEQAETIAKLQQLNALLRQELEQRKADEAPLRDFLQRLLDRDQQSSAYDALRGEIITIGRSES